MKTITTIRNIIYTILYMLDRYILRKKADIVILCYHSIATDTWRFSIDYSMLKKQIEFLKKEQYTFISLKDIENHILGKTLINKPSVVITFDDGYKDLLQTIPYFKENHIAPALFLLADTKNANREELATNRVFLNKKEILQLIKNGWDMGCHSSTHSDLSRLSSTSLEKEIIDAKIKLEALVHKKMFYFAYPKGRYTSDVITNVKKAQYTMGLSMDDGFISGKTNRYAVPRVGVDRTHSLNEFKATFSPSVILFRRFVKHTLGIII